MKLFGQVIVLFCKPTHVSLETIIERNFPGIQSSHCYSALGGLSGTSYCVETDQGRFAARKLPTPTLPDLSLHRHAKALKNLPSGMAPELLYQKNGWLVTYWLAGDVKTSLPPDNEVSALLYRLHQQPLFGWRIQLLPLLEFYWQQCDPARRTVQWLRELKHLKRTKEPQPLRLAPLHMDVHAGNIVRHTGGLGLIDWEYATDGDVAMELATVLLGNKITDNKLIADYARQASLEYNTLKRQIAKWLPWMALVMASWFECRFWQTRQQQFIMLADDAWRVLWAIKKREALWVQ